MPTGLEPLKIELLAVDNASATISSVEKQIKNFSTTQEKSSETTDKTTKSVEKYAKSILKIGVSYSAIKSVVRFIGDATEASADYVEALNLFEVAMDGNVKAGKAFVDQMEEVLGLDKAELLEYTGLFNQMALAIGNTTETAYTMSLALTSIGADIASLYNIDVATAMSKLRSGIAGQVKPVRELGMDITSISLDRLLQEELKLEGVTSKTLSQAQKQLGRTILLIQQSENAWGDMSKTINTYSNQQKILEAQVNKLQRSLGNLFIGTTEKAGIMTKAIWYVNGAFMALNDIINAFIPEMEESGLNGTLGETASATNETTEAIEDLEQAVNGSLLSFDKFNALNKGSGALGDSSITKLLESLLDTEYDRYLEEYNKKLEQTDMKAKEIAKSIKAWIGVNEENKITWDSLNPVLKTAVAIIGVLLVNATANAIISLGALVKSLLSVSNIIQLMSKSALMVAIVVLVDLIAKWEDYNEVQKAVRIALIALLVAINLFLATKGSFMEVIKSFTSGLLTLTLRAGSTKIAILQLSIASIAFIATIAGVIGIIENWGNMNTFQKIVSVLSVLTVALLGAGMAFGVFHSAMTMGLATAGIIAGIVAMTAVIASAKGQIDSLKVSAYASGGLPQTGEMFIARESGPEYVGRLGNRNVVANNDQIVSSVSQGVYSAVVDALGKNSNANKPVNVYLDKHLVGKIVANPVRDELVRTGKFAKV